jgi:hypothetical protein
MLRNDRRSPDLGLALPRRLPVQRLYIYRCGATNACASTGEKGEPRLLAPLTTDRWQFWMQTSSHQSANGVYGFTLESAAPQIVATRRARHPLLRA